MAKRGQTLKSTKKIAFLDSSVLFTATNSPAGGSSKLFTLKGVELTTSKVVLTEVERNVRKKLQSYHLERFFMLAGKLTITQQAPKQSLIKKAEKAIVKKDAVILAEAKHAKTDFLVTLDKKHFLKPGVEKFLKPQKVLTPKILLEQIKD